MKIATAQRVPAAGERLPSLDGLRALAVLMVVFAHAEATKGWPGWWWMEELRKAASGFAGVQIFFVISGFIITWLLLAERDGGRGISLGQFWYRRSLRIIPPLVVYLGALSLMKAAGLLEVSTLSQLGSLFFFRNHLPDSDAFNAHSWSLSVEEQFYLVWPVLVAVLPGRWLRVAAWGVIGVSFLSRVLLVVWEGDNWRWLVFQADCLMAGALGAMWLQGRKVVALQPLVSREIWAHLGWLLLVLAVCRACATRFSPYFTPVQPLLLAPFVTVWIVRLVTVRQGLVYQILNFRILAFVGTVSYGTYLWQQLFTSAPKYWLVETPWVAQFPQNLPLSLLAGTASFYLVEFPVKRFRALREKRMKATSRAGVSAA